MSTRHAALPQLCIGYLALLSLAGCGFGLASFGTSPIGEDGPDASTPVDQAATDGSGGPSGEDGGVTPGGGSPPPVVDYDAAASTGVMPVFDPSATLEGRNGFFKLPWPSDLRADASGALDASGFPAPRRIMEDFRAQAAGMRGASVLPVVYFKFGKPLRERNPSDVLSGPGAPLLLVELPRAAGEAPRLLPLVAQTLREDAYVPDDLLAVAPRPGFVLSPSRSYAVIVRRDLLDAQGNRLGVPSIFQTLAKGQRPEGARGEELVRLYAPVFAALDALRIPRAELSAATTFTTGDRVQELFELSERLRQRHRVELTEVRLDSSPRVENPRYCHFTATISLPQFQRGTPTFDRDGLFETGPDGLPIVQRQEVALVSLTLPKSPMPAGGFPLTLFFHGSGGQSRYGIDGNEAEADLAEIQRRPAYQLAGQGISLAAMSLPLSPDRVPGASAFSYVNPNNPVAMRDTFRQGIIESRLFLDALERLRISPADTAACAGASLPAGEPAYRFKTSRISAQGQSMGGMYTNLLSPVEPRVGAAVPTAAGGYWTYFAFRTPKIPQPSALLGVALGSSLSIDWLHPAMSLAQHVWEVVDPLASAPRLARRPLAGHPARHVFQPVGDGDSYFARPVYEAMTLAYGHPLAGSPGWPGALDALRLGGLDAPVGYPVRENLSALSGSRFTGVSVQLPEVEGDDGHSVYLRLPAVRYQYRCFHRSFHGGGAAVVSAPLADDSAFCP